MGRRLLIVLVLNESSLYDVRVVGEELVGWGRLEKVEILVVEPLI